MKILNYIIQVLFVRLTKCSQIVTTHAKLASMNIVKGGDLSMGFTPLKTETRYWYSLQYFIIPFSGWKGKPFKYYGKQRFLKITKTKIKP